MVSDLDVKEYHFVEREVYTEEGVVSSANFPGKNIVWNILHTRVAMIALLLESEVVSYWTFIIILQALY